MALIKKRQQWSRWEEMKASHEDAMQLTSLARADPGHTPGAVKDTLAITDVIISSSSFCVVCDHLQRAQGSVSVQTTRTGRENH